ncbi:MAG: glycosyltransferase family 39 protein [Phycisphaerales bacterium JB065]
MDYDRDEQPTPIQISVIVPTLNEAENIGTLFERIHLSLDGLYRYEIIVVDDGSEDGTRERVRDLDLTYPVRLICRERQGGLSGAVVHGAQVARGDVVVVMDADLSHPPEDLPRVIEPVMRGSHDVSVGSRHVVGGKIVGWPLRRHVTSRVAASLASPFVDITDPMAGYFATSRDRLASVNPGVGGFKILLDLLAAEQPLIHVCEVPIEFRDREYGESKLTGGVIHSYLRQLVRLTGFRADTGSAARFGLVGCLGVLVDLSLFTMLTSLGTTFGVAHLTSFFAATLFNFVLNAVWSFKKPGEKIAGLTVGRYAAFLGVCLAALFIRGGIVASGIELGALPIVSVLLGIGAAALVNYLGSAMFVFGTQGRLKTIAQWRVVAVAVVVYTVLLRLVYMGVVDLLPEEAYYWNYAKHLDIGYLDHPPMISWLIGLSTSVLGNNEFAVRLPALACWMVALGFVVALAARVIGRNAAFAAGAMFSVLPYFFIDGAIATPDSPLVACWAAGLFFLHRAISGGHHRSWLWFGLAIGLGMLSKYTIAILGPAALVIMLLDRNGRRAFLTPWPYLGALVSLVVFSPVIYWNATHGWASFEFQTVRRLAEEPKFGIPFLGLSLLLLLSPAGLLSAFRVLGIRAWQNSACARRDRRFLMLAAVVPLGVFVLFSLKHEPKLNWTGPLWLALLPLMALDFEPLLNRIKDASGRFSLSLGWRLTFVITLFLFGTGMHYMSLGLPHTRYLSSTSLPVGWEEIGSAIEEIEDRYEHELGIEPMVVGMDKYNLASLLAFYRAKYQDTGCSPREGWEGTASSHLFGHAALMYEMWFPRQSVEGRDCILVAYDENGLTDAYLSPWFDELLPIQKIEISKNRESVHTFYWRLGKGYREKTTLPIDATALSNPGSEVQPVAIAL